MGLLPRLQYYRLESSGERCWVAPEYHDRLAHWGLLDPVDVAGNLAGPGVSFDERRTAVRHLCFDDESVFLKFYIQPSLARRLRTRLRGRRNGMWHELSILDRVAAAGLRAPAPIAVGLVPSGHRFRTYLLMTSINNHVPLEHIMFGSMPEMLSHFSQRSDLTRRIAQIVRRLHSAGILNHTLYTRHIYVRPGGTQLDDLALIDLEQAYLGSPNRSRIAEDLAALLLTSTPQIQRTDCMRFLEAYFGSPRDNAAVKRLWRKTASVVRRKRSQSRFKQYQGRLLMNTPAQSAFGV